MARDSVVVRQREYRRERSISRSDDSASCSSDSRDIDANSYLVVPTGRQHVRLSRGSHHDSRRRHHSSSRRDAGTVVVRDERLREGRDRDDRSGRRPGRPPGTKRMATGSVVAGISSITLLNSLLTKLKTGSTDPVSRKHPLFILLGSIFGLNGVHARRGWSRAVRHARGRH